jgi:predicted RNA-binding Zn-ribbon protein involved in translation (DUF1610 family)
MSHGNDDEGNTNCLQGKRCPKCGQNEHFDIEVRRIVTLYDEGINDDDCAHTDYDDTSSATCPDCGHADKWGNFDAK